MKARRFRLTKAAKIILVVLIMAAIGGGLFWGVKSGVIKTKSDDGKITAQTKPAENAGSEQKPGKPSEKNPATTADKGSKDSDEVIDLSLDEWIGWKSIIDANGGLTTQPGSIYDKLGIKVNINVINDATQSSNALISRKLDAAGYTINRTAFLSKKFKDGGLNVVMPFITNFSNGGDGIIAKSTITSVNDLADAKIGVPQFSEAHSLVVWFVNQSDMPEETKKAIIENLILFETPDETAKAFFAGKIDVAATWEPYLTQAQNMSDAHVLFSTATSSSLIMDGILFNSDFAEQNPDIVTAFIDGALQASDLYKTEMNTIKSVMPMFSAASDEDVIGSCESAKLTTFADNLALFDGTARTIFTDMCDVWKSIGEEVDESILENLYDAKYIDTLSEKYDATVVTTSDNRPVVTEDNKDRIMETEALLQKSASVNFIINTAKFTDPAEATQKLDDFISIAKVLDGTIIEIAGNTDPNPYSDPGDVANKLLSQQRAETVKQYFVLNGISADRIITVGNGSSNPVVDNDTEEHKAMNRRTDVSFKCIE